MWACAFGLCCTRTYAQTLLSAANCKQTRRTSGYTGRFGWEDAPDHALVAFSETKTEGEVSLFCTFKVGMPASGSEVRLGRLHIAFTGPETAGSGIVLSVRNGPHVLWEKTYRQVAGEDWIEVGPRHFIVPLPLPTKQVQFVLKLIDASPKTSLRVDLDGISMKAVQ